MTHYDESLYRAVTLYRPDDHWATGISDISLLSSLKNALESDCK